ncbi:MAG TPA: hypothetical protein VF618_24290 [Thermoanaerobaculia bacterium]
MAEDQEEPELQNLAMLEPVRLKGYERFFLDGEKLPLNVRQFWQWSVSDLLSNLTRGRLAEFLVACALGVDVTRGVRREWDAFDLLTPCNVKVEVKSAAYLQTWFQKETSKITWTVGPTRAWDAATNVFSAEVKWQADVYVLALFEAKSKSDTSAPLDVARWRFFVAPVEVLREHGKRAWPLAAVERLVREGRIASVRYDWVKVAVCCLGHGCEGACGEGT